MVEFVLMKETWRISWYVYIYVYIVYIEMQCNPVSYKVWKISQLVSQISSIIRMNSLDNKQYVYGRLRGSQINFFPLKNS